MLVCLASEARLCTCHEELLAHVEKAGSLWCEEIAQLGHLGFGLCRVWDYLYCPSPSKSIVTLIHFVFFSRNVFKVKNCLVWKSSCLDLLGWKGLQEVDLGLRVYGQVVWRRKDHSGNVCGPQERRLTSEGDVRCCRRLSGEQHHRPGTGKVPCDVQTFL